MGVPADSCAQAISLYTDAQARTSPVPGLNTIAWLLWHVARTEDCVINRLVGHRSQVFFDQDWARRLNVPRLDFGVGMTADEVADLSASINLEEAKACWKNVEARTREIVGLLSPEDLDEVNDPDDIRQAIEKDGMMRFFDPGEWAILRARHGSLARFRHPLASEDSPSEAPLDIEADPDRLLQRRHLRRQQKDMTQVDVQILKNNLKVVTNMTTVWSKVKKSVAQAAKKDAADKTDKKELQALFKSFDEGLTPKLKAVASAKDMASYRAAVSAVIAVLKSYQTKVRAANDKKLLKAAHYLSLLGILSIMQENLEGKQKAIDDTLINRLI